MSSGSNTCKTSSGRCAFCGEYLGSTSIPIVYESLPEGKGAFAKLKPLRWRFLTNKAPRTKYMCGVCAEKRLVPQQTEDLAVRLVGSKDPTSLQKQQLSQHSDQVLRLENLQEPRDKQRRAQVKQQKREKLQNFEPQEQSTGAEGRRRISSQTSESTPRGSVLHPFVASKESMMKNRPVSVVEMGTRSSNSKPRAASVDIPSRSRKTSSGQSEPFRCEKKESRRSQTDQRMSSTADILGMSRSLELPSDYFAMSRDSMDNDPLTVKHLEMNSPQLETQKQHETEEERQHRHSVAYAQMLLRMRRHYDAVQVNGARGPPATAPPRRVRAERRAKSVAVRNVKDDPVNNNLAGLFTVDLAYLRAYKDAR